MTARTCSQPVPIDACGAPAVRVVFVPGEEGRPGYAADACARCAEESREWTGGEMTSCASPFCANCGGPSCGDGDGWSCPGFCGGRGPLPSCSCASCVAACD